MIFNEHGGEPATGGECVACGVGIDGYYNRDRCDEHESRCDACGKHDPMLNLGYLPDWYTTNGGRNQLCYKCYARLTSGRTKL